jgi:hypothetical protein
MITGIAGAIMGYKAYQRSGAIKALDLRLELQRAEHALQTDIDGLPALVERAHSSRLSVLAASGRSVSGSALKLNETIESTAGEIESVKRDLPEQGIKFEEMTLAELEERIIVIHVLQSRVSRLIEHFKSEISADGEYLKQRSAASFLAPQR